MSGYNRNLQLNQNISNNNLQNRGFFNKIFRDLSNFGMNYEDMMMTSQNSVTDNITTNAVGQSDSYQTYYEFFTKRVISKILSRKSLANLDRTYEDKRKILRQYSIKDEIKKFLNIICDECVSYDEDNFFCQVLDLPQELDETIRQKYIENFKKVYYNFGFNDGITAWNYLKNLMIDGHIAFEIVFDSKMKSVKDLIPLDPITILPATDPETNTLVWIIYPDDPMRRKILLDVQLIYISYSNNNEYSETSYIEPLIRPYNQLKLIEQTRMLYNINQAAIYKKFIVPVNGLTRQQAEQQIRQLMSEYHEEISFDDTMGTVLINGARDIPHSKDFWFPSGEAGTPTIDIIPTNGTNLNEDIMLQWFYKNLKRETRIPFGRFDESTGGGNVYSAASEISRDELRFNTFIKRIRTIFKEIMIKPLRTQMILDFPELMNDNYFLSNIKLKYYSNELFEEWNYLTNLQKRAEIASTLTANLQEIDSEGNQVPYLHIELIVRKIMKFTDDDIAENNRYKEMDKQKKMAIVQGGQAQGGQVQPQTQSQPQPQAQPPAQGF